MIIDPNRQDNDISGGSGEVGKIFAHLKGAYDQISARMNDLEDLADQRSAGSIKESIMGCIFAGDYSSFEEQRSRMKTIYDQYQANGGLPQAAIPWVSQSGMLPGH